LWFDWSAREETVSTPQVPAGPDLPAPDPSPDDDGPQTPEGFASAVDRARRMVPEGTFAVGAGLAIAGVTTYGFQILAFRGLSKQNYAALNLLWVFVFVLAPGVFLPLEQEIGRAVSARLVRGVGGGPVVRRAGMLGGAFAILLASGIIVLTATTNIVQNKFNGHVGLMVCLIVSLFTFGIEYLARGAFAGVGRFGAYGLSLGAEGVIRLLPCIPLAMANVTNPFWYGLCLAVPPLIATGIAMYGQHGLATPGPPAPWSELSSNLGFLLGGSLLAQVLSYAPFLGAQVLAKTPTQRMLVADFVVGLFLSRIPILLFQAVQAALLPKLSTLVSAGKDSEFQNGVRTLVVIVAGIGILGVVVGGLIGPFVGRILFGAKFNLGHADVALLAAGSGLFILALTLSQALIALSGHRQNMLAWLIGLLAFLVATAFLSHDLFLRVELGSIAGAGVSAAAMGLLFLNRLSKGVQAGSLASLVEQIEYGPLEI
jgi:O-antigen/teichoic acid export membrane protein